MDSQGMNRFMKSALNSWQQFAIALGVATLVVVMGCGGDDSGLGRRYKVTGKVTYNGANVPHGTVTFVPVKPPPPEGRAASGEIKDGYYSLTTTGDNDGHSPAITTSPLSPWTSIWRRRPFEGRRRPRPRRRSQVHQGRSECQEAHSGQVRGERDIGIRGGTVDGAKTIDFPLTD